MCEFNQSINYEKELNVTLGLRKGEQQASVLLRGLSVSRQDTAYRLMTAKGPRIANM